jgi:hypothetical protein
VVSPDHTQAAGNGRKEDIMDAFALRLIRERNAANGGHWFDADTLRFFRSRLPTGCVGRVDNTAWFVTSEAGPFGRGPRAYTVRRADVVTGHVDTDGAFRGYATRGAAMSAARASVRQAKADYREDLTHFSNRAAEIDTAIAE